ncbi:MAG: hypothetical protein HYT13_00025 [Candidatus Liptonbacteria bacterium]|nr:hypothetical protein [Candidatus Liptonbacteria bacterium]
MNFALTYLIQRFFYRIFDFFHHWYHDAVRVFNHWVIIFYERLDQTFALRITLKYFFHPLYKDYTIVGRILGVIFRSGRIFLSLIVYSFFGLIFIGFYLLWIVLPPTILIYALRGF